VLRAGRGPSSGVSLGCKDGGAEEDADTVDEVLVVDATV